MGVADQLAPLIRAKLAGMVALMEAAAETVGINSSLAAVAILDDLAGAAQLGPSGCFGLETLAHSQQLVSDCHEES